MNNKVDISSTAVEKGIDLVRDFVGQLISPSATELGLLIKDQISLWRFNNQVSILLKARDKCERNNINVKAIAPKLLVPYLEHAALEDNDVMQEKWATLLTNMVDSKKNIENHVFPYILSQLSNDEFEVLESGYKADLGWRDNIKTNLEKAKSEELELDKNQADVSNISLKHELRDATIRIERLEEQLKTPPLFCHSEFKEYEFANLVRLGLIRVSYDIQAGYQNFEVPPRRYINEPVSVDFKIDMEKEESVFLTGLGSIFIEACSSED